MSGNTGAVRSFNFPPPDGAASCTLTETFKVLNRPIYKSLLNFHYIVLKGGSTVRHHKGLNQMYPDKSYCLNFSANGYIGLTG